MVLKFENVRKHVGSQPPTRTVRNLGKAGAQRSHRSHPRHRTKTRPSRRRQSADGHAQMESPETYQRFELPSFGRRRKRTNAQRCESLRRRVLYSSTFYTSKTWVPPPEQCKVSQSIPSSFSLALSPGSRSVRKLPALSHFVAVLVQKNDGLPRSDPRLPPRPKRLPSTQDDSPCQRRDGRFEKCQTSRHFGGGFGGDERLVRHGNAPRHASDEEGEDPSQPARFLPRARRGERGDDARNFELG